MSDYTHIDYQSHPRIDTYGIELEIDGQPVTVQADVSGDGELLDVTGAPEGVDPGVVSEKIREVLERHHLQEER